MAKLNRQTAFYCRERVPGQSKVTELFVWYKLHWIILFEASINLTPQVTFSPKIVDILKLHLTILLLLAH